MDYPRYWPGLVDDLLAVLRGGDALRRRRGYLVLHHVLKELSSKRLASDQRTFAQARDAGRVPDEVTGETGTSQEQWPSPTVYRLVFARFLDPHTPN